MISVGDEKQARSNIRFLAESGLIADKELAKRLLAAPSVGVLPAANAIIPGPHQLHVLAIGISDYGEKAKDLTLKYAAQDAAAVANALLRQAGGLYVNVKLFYLPDKDASRAGIFEAFDAMQRGVKADDLTVVMFSGHMVVVDGEPYFLTYGVDPSVPATLKASAIQSRSSKNSF